MDSRLKRQQTTRPSARRCLRRKLDQDFEESAERSENTAPIIEKVAGGDDPHRDLIGEIRRHVEVLNNRFSAAEADRAAAKAAAHALSELAKNKENVQIIVEYGAVPALVRHLESPWPSGGGENGARPLEHEVEKECAVALGLVADKPEYQQLIADFGAMVHLVKLLKWDQACKAGSAVQAADLITHLANENPKIKTLVRTEGGIPPLVELLTFVDIEVQKAAAGALRTLSLRNDENKNQIVELNALPSLVLMLRSKDYSVRHVAVSAIGNLVHSSPDIKKEVLCAGALQPVIRLLRSPSYETQREAALLLGRFASADSDCKPHIAQRGAIMPLVKMLESPDTQVKAMSSFALSRLSEDTHNQAGIGHCGGIAPLIRLLDLKMESVQYNAAFALHCLADNEDNVVDFIRVGGVQKLQNGEFIFQLTKDCVASILKRLEDKIDGPASVLSQLLNLLRTGDKIIQTQIALSLAHLYRPENGKIIFIHYRGLKVLLLALGSTNLKQQKCSAAALFRLATKASSSALEDVVPSSPSQHHVFLSEKFVNDPTASDIAFLVEGKRFYAHKTCLVASSDAFRAMFDGFCKENDAQDVEIPNIRWEVFELVMRFIYTGNVNITADIAQDLLRAADQYHLEGLKRLCEHTIAKDISDENISLMYELANAYNSKVLRRSCALFALKHFNKLTAKPLFSKFVKHIIPEVESYIIELLTMPDQDN